MYLSNYEIALNVLILLMQSCYGTDSLMSLFGCSTVSLN